MLGIFIYLGLSTTLSEATLIGEYGATFAHYNHHYFGYLSYVIFIALMAPLYFLYKSFEFDGRRVELYGAFLLLVFSIFLIQAIVVRDEFRGAAAGSLIDFFDPYVGLFGVWIFWLITFSISLLVIFDTNIQNIFSFLKPTKAPVVQQDELYDDEDYFDDVEEQSSVTKVVEVAVEPVVQNEVQLQEEPLHVEEVIKLDEEAEEVKVQEIKEVEDVKSVEKVAETSKSEPAKVKESSILQVADEVKKKKNTVIVEELEENTKILNQIERGEVKKPTDFILPHTNFLQKVKSSSNLVDESELDDKIKDLIEKLAHFKVNGDVVRTYAGPVVSTFEFKPAADVKVSKILNLQDDLAMALRAETIRIQAPIPGKDVVGIEIPNRSVETIYLREIFESKLFQEASSPLTIALGKDIVGKPFITDLKKLPHLLIAGTTGSGKSVGINAMILSLLYKNSPDQLRLLMIDPKMLEFSIYNDIPHLLTPVITKAKQAIVALSNMVGEMERRYLLMSETKTKNIENYNEKVEKIGGEKFPYIVVIIDELADLMMTSGKDVEFSIARLAQMARASGIHLVVATQRPSVDVVTGLIKANLPSRISYKVGQRIDSKIILDQQGAESLLGRGDMLFTPPGMSGLIRLHAPWSSEDEIEKIVDFIKSQREPQYDKRFLVEESSSSGGESVDFSDELDELYEDARDVVINDKKTSISYLQRKLQIGYNRSARIIEQLEQRGVLSAPNNKGNREIL
ncbi:MAG: DNA translocase FtsK [Campylobacterota bacterium]|nr:DNA translocase FtsK [Campylobacterota bacterium]